MPLCTAKNTWPGAIATRYLQRRPSDTPTPEAVNYRCCYRKLCLFRHSAFNGPSEYECTYTYTLKSYNIGNVI